MATSPSSTAPASSSTPSTSAARMAQSALRPSPATPAATRSSAEHSSMLPTSTPVPSRSSPTPRRTTTTPTHTFSSFSSSNDAGIELAPGVFAPEAALRFQFARSGGPGGQNVNKLNTKAELWVPVAALRGLAPDALERLLLLAGRRLTREGEIHVVAETARTQEGNRSAALERLRQLLVQALRRPKPRRRTR